MRWMRNASAACCVLTACAAWAQPCGGLVGYWPLEGNAADLSTAGNQGVLHGTPQFVPGTSGWAMNLDGVDDFVSVANAASLNPASALTISAWYRPATFSGSGNDPIVDKGYVAHSPPYYQYHLGVTGDLYPYGRAGFGFNLRGAGGAGTNLNFWVPGTWYHLVGTWDGASVALYVNGVEVNRNPFASTVPDYGQPVYFGRFNNLGFYLPGAIDEIRIFDRGLNADEVELLYRNPDGAPMATPAQTDTCPGSTVELRIVSLAPDGARFQWRKDGIEIPDANGASIRLLNITSADAGLYDCTVTTACGSSISSPARVNICPGEFNCDGGIDGGDVESFFAIWEAGDPAADVNEDGGIDGADVEFFFARWEAGC